MGTFGSVTGVDTLTIVRCLQKDVTHATTSDALTAEWSRISIHEECEHISRDHMNERQFAFLWSSNLQGFQPLRCDALNERYLLFRLLIVRYLYQYLAKALHKHRSLARDGCHSFNNYLFSSKHP